MSVYRPHKSFIRFIKDFDPRLTVRANRYRNHAELPFVICLPVLMPLEVTPGVLKVSRVEYPILYIPQAFNNDQGILQALRENHRSQTTDLGKQMRAEQRAEEKAHLDQVFDWSKDHYRDFKRSIEPYNLANLDKHDPAADVKRLEDKLGRKVGMLA